MIHPLARKNAKSGKITFIHSDGKEHTFSTCVNDLTGDRLSWFDNSPPTVNEKLSSIRKTFLDIRKKAKVVSFEGDF